MPKTRKVRKATNVKKTKPLATTIAETNDIKSLMGIYNLIKYRGASVGKFDFKADFMSYKYYVEGRLDDLRKLTNSRLKKVGEAAKKKLGETALAKAKERYQRNYESYAKKILESDGEYPKHLMKIRGGIAYFTTDPNRRLIFEPSSAPFVENKKPKPSDGKKEKPGKVVRATKTKATTTTKTKAKPIPKKKKARKF